jgi:hypothetical protein
MTALAIGSSATVSLDDGGEVSVSSNGGFFTVSETPSGGSTSVRGFGPGVFRGAFGPYKEGGRVVVYNASSSSLDLDSNLENFGVPVPIYKNYEGISHTGTTAATILASVLIPAGTIVAPASLEMYLRYQIAATATAGNRSIYQYLNTVNSLSGATLMSNASHNTTGVTYSYTRDFDSIVFTSSTAQIGGLSSAGANSSQGTIADRAGTLSTASDMYWIFSAQLADASDSMLVRAVRLSLSQ